MTTDNRQANMQAQSLRGQQIRAAKEAHKRETKMAELQFEAATAHYRPTLDQWRKDRIAEIDAQYDVALRAACPDAVQARDSAVIDADEQLSVALEAADAAYQSFLTRLQRDKERAKRAKDWPEMRELHLAGKQILYSLKEVQESDQYRVERGIMTPEEAHRQLVLQAEMLLGIMPDKLAADGETEWARQLVGLTQ